MKVGTVKAIMRSISIDARAVRIKAINDLGIDVSTPSISCRIDSENANMEHKQ